MVRWEHMKGLPVVSLAEGKEVGKVDSLVIDPDTRSVVWIRIHAGGLMGERRLVPVSQVHAIGEHAVTIERESDAQLQAEVPGADELVKAKRPVLGNKVLTETGQHLGEVRDIEIDPANFALTSLYVTPSMEIFGRAFHIPADKIRTIGHDAIVVTPDAVPKPEPGPEGGESPIGAGPVF